MRCRLGIGRTYQVPRPFEDMTVFENVLVAAQQGGGQRGQASYDAGRGALDDAGLLAGRRTARPARSDCSSASAWSWRGRSPPRPRLLLLDEVAGGLTDPEMVELVDVVRRARAGGVAIIWIEHVVRALVETVDRLICLAGGRIIGDGEPAEVLASPAVKEVFLGTEATAESLAEAGLAEAEHAEP